MQKMAEKRRARKLAKKERQQQLQQEEQTRKAQAKEQRRKHKNDGADDDAGDEEYNMRSLAKEAKLKAKVQAGSKSKNVLKELKKIAAKNKTSGEFEVDLGDDRFAAVVEGDARYAIDPTSTLFKQTAGMKSILDEQRKRKRDADPDFAQPGSKRADPEPVNNYKDEANEISSKPSGSAKALADKLKKKFKK